MKKKILMIQLNSEGRPCGWGLSPVLPPPDLSNSAKYIQAKETATAEAQRQWDKHSCYPGEKKGKLVEHRLVVDDEEVHRS